ncbi:MAG: hypothetical protein ACREUU_15530 [Gammaproteobacteria bacterium]
MIVAIYARVGTADQGRPFTMARNRGFERRFGYFDGELSPRHSFLTPAQSARRKPSFNHITPHFADEDFEFVANIVAVYDMDHALLLAGGAGPQFLKSTVNLTFSKSQAGRIIAIRLRRGVRVHYGSGVEGSEESSVPDHGPRTQYGAGTMDETRPESRSAMNR